MTKRRFLGKGLILIGLGYLAGLLTSPKRKKRKGQTVNSSYDLRSLEKELKRVYSQTREALGSLTGPSDKMTDKVEFVKSKALSSQQKVKHLLSAIHGQDNVDDDLNKALQEAKSALSSLKKYIVK